MFNPSFSFINGIRNSKSGWEFGFGPTFRFSRNAWGYHDQNNNWNAIKNMSGQYYENDPGFLDTQNNGSFESVTSPNGYVSTQSVGVLDDGGNPYNIERRMDSRGPVAFSPSFVFAIGKTFKSGYLNIPVNLFLSSSKSGQFVGLSMGFNIAKKE